MWKGRFTLNFLFTIHCKCVCVLYEQDVVVFGDDHLLGTDVHFLLVLRNRRHGDRHHDIQIHRVPRVRFHGDSACAVSLCACLCVSCFLVLSVHVCDCKSEVIRCCLDF